MTDIDLIPQETIGLWHATDFTGVIQEATQAADALGAVVKDRKLTVKIQGRHHVLVEGWTLLGTMLGVQPYVVWSLPLGLRDDQVSADGWEARVEARTLDGRTISAAEAQCTRQERTWRNRDDYALRSMAQTRAVSKALRLPLGFVMSIAGYEATPAEEMPTTNPDLGPRQTIVIGPDADPMEKPRRKVLVGPPDEPGPDFGPVTDPMLEDDYQGSTFKAPEPRKTDTQVGPITDPQRKKVYALLSKLKRADPVLYSDDNVTDQLKLQYGTEHISELNRADARDLIDRLLQREAALTDA